MKFKVITLCGSTRFKDDFLKVQTDLTLQGIIVLSLGLFSQAEDHIALTDEKLEQLGQMHKQKIDMADGIFVINRQGYIGSSTQSEIDYARAKGKTVEFLEPVTY